MVTNLGHVEVLRLVLVSVDTKSVCSLTHFSDQLAFFLMVKTTYFWFSIGKTIGKMKNESLSLEMSRFRILVAILAPSILGEMALPNNKY